MAQQKLYTEEQVRNAIRLAKKSRNVFISTLIYSIEEVMEELTPIQVPTDEEIEKESHNYFIRGQLGLEAAADTERAFLKGILWMKDKILNK